MTTINAVGVGLSGATGTGNFVGATSPSITTPSIVTKINDTNGNELIGITATATAVNFVNITNNATGSAPIIAGTGSDNNVALTLTTKGTGGVIVKGTGTNDNAASGNVGEFISSVVSSGSPVSVTHDTATDVTSISLSAGDWDVYGNANMIPTGTALTGGNVWMSLTSATAPDASLINGVSETAGTYNTIALNAPFLRVSITTTTNVYLSVVAGTHNATVSGGIYARRAR